MMLKSWTCGRLRLPDRPPGMLLLPSVGRTLSPLRPQGRVLAPPDTPAPASDPLKNSTTAVIVLYDLRAEL